MPFVVNGIGTWYYGKRHMHSHDGTCQFCGAAATLSSYDTTLFLVVVFVPVLPLGRKRILDACSYCQKHRVLGLKDWERAKAADVAEVMEKLDRDPRDRDTAARALGLAIAYQDEPLLNEFLGRIGGAHRRDGAFQAQLGDTYSYFARWEDAEESYRASLRAEEENESVREALAWVLLKQGRPREARSLLKHVLSDRKEQSAYLIFHVISGYQAEGLHDEALELMDARDKAFPDQAVLKECEQQRKTSMRNRGTQKRIGGVSPRDAGRAGYKEGNWSASMPRWIAALVVVGLLGGYFGSAAWIGQARQVHLVNGTRRPYTVAIAGQEHVLNPGGPKPIRVPEGDVEVQFADPQLGFPPILARIETSFWTRPFASHAFVINPDQTAVIVQQETTYAANPQNAPPPPPATIHFGQAFYHIAGMDYIFEPFPQTISVKGGGTVTKTRVGMGPFLSDETQLNFILQKVPLPEQLQVCERLLRLDPSRSRLLHWLTTQMNALIMLKILEPRLDERPILVEWHRAYQSLMERVEPGTDLRPRYEKLLADTNGNADAFYLLGRAEPDLDKGEKLYEQAATANPPSGHALYGLGYRALSEGRFADAVVALDKAMPVLPDKSLYRHIHTDILLAAGEHDRLLNELRAELQGPDRKLAVLVEICRLQAIRGQKAEARATIAQAVNISGPAQQEAVRTALESSLCCWENDLAGYLKNAAGAATFEDALLRGQMQQAADLVATAPKHELGAFYGLLYLQAKRAGDQERADFHWQALLTNLKNGGREDRRFAEALSQPKLSPDFPWRRLPIDPRVKRVLLAVLADRHPDQATAILELAHRLDFQRDAISFCLAKVLNGGKN